jgi:hypothetical protein
MTATAILDLEHAGFSREQGEALARWHEAGTDLTSLATEADLADANAALDKRIVEIRRDLAEVWSDLQVPRMTVRAGGIVSGAAAALGACLRRLPGGYPQGGGGIG